MSQQPDQPEKNFNDLPDKETGLLAFIRRNQQRLGLLFTIVVFILALVAFSHLVEDIDRQSLTQAFSRVTWQAIGLAILAAIISYCMIFGYEWSASRYANAKLTIPTLALGGLSAAAVGNALGFSMLTGGSVRYRVYSKKNTPAIAIIQMTVFASLSLGLALPPIAALMAFSDLAYSARALHINESVLIVIASLVVIGYILFLLVASRFIAPTHPTPDSRNLCFGLVTLRVPSLQITMLQFIITFLDVLAAGSVLYCLLPTSVAIPFGTFLTVYLLALAAGVLSHVPGGLGVFEVVLLAAFKEQLDQPGLLAALFLYRLIYVVMPLLVACLVLLVAEARRFAATRQAVRIVSSIAAPIMALLVFISGVALLFSGVTPEHGYRLDYLSTFIPDFLVNVSHLTASLIGTLCLVLAQGLWRRLSAAWLLTFILLLTGVALSLLKGLDWKVACLLLFTASLLFAFRKVFYRPSRLFDIPFSPITLAVAGCTIAVSIWLFFFVYRHVPYSAELWWEFTLDANTPRGLRAITGSTILLAAIILMWLLRTSPPKIQEPSDEQLLVAEQIIQNSYQPSGGLIFGKDKDLLFHPEQDAFIMYSCHGRSLIALFDPIGNPQHRNELIWQFRDYCDYHHVRPVFYQVKADTLSDYMDIGLTALKLGEEAIINLAEFDLDSKGKKDLRYTWNRGGRDGLSLNIYEKEEVPFASLKAISDAWLVKKPGRERGFSLGKLNPDYLRHFRIATVEFEGRIVAFVNLLETKHNNLVGIDLMRVHPDAPKLTMEYLMVALILKFKEQGIQRFSLGFAPLSGLKPRRGAPLAHRLGSLVFRRGNQFYNFQGLRRFKEKFQPEWEPLYMAVPAGLDPLIALTDTAALIAGSLTGLVKRQ